MKRFHQTFSSGMFGWLVVPVILLLFIPNSVQGQDAVQDQDAALVPAGPTNWNVALGAQSADASAQAMAFLPNEVWINAGDSVTWTSNTGEAHTVSFLVQPEAAATPGGFPAGAVTRPSFNATGPGSLFGCQGGNQGGAAPTTPAGIPMSGPGANAAWDYLGTECVNSGPTCVDNLQPNGQPDDSCPLSSFTVTFVNPGNYKLVCLIHSDMTGVVHVAPAATAYPHDQNFYNNQGINQAQNLLNRAATPSAVPPDQVISTGVLTATAGGKQYLAMMRFFPQTITINVGDTVQWEDQSPDEPHTVTFLPPGGTEPPAPVPVGAAPDPQNSAVDGKLPNAVGCGVVGASCFNSGFIQPANQDQTGLPQTPTLVQRARVTFTAAGVYNYYCILHDDLGMSGRVIVLGNTPLIVPTGPLPNGTVGVPYSQQLMASGGTPPYNWVLIGGAIPPGFTLSPSGLLSGTTSSPFWNNFYVQVSDNGGKSVTPGGYYSVMIN